MQIVVQVARKDYTAFARAAVRRLRERSPGAMALRLVVQVAILLVVYGALKQLLGGHPFWVQWPDPPYGPRRPFFLQLYPEGELMLGDGGHLHVFLDPSRPGRGYDVRLQMY